MRFPERRARHVHINLRRRDRAVPQKLLQAESIPAVSDKQRRAGVP